MEIDGLDVAALSDGEAKELVDDLRREVAEEFGFVCPPVEVLSLAADDAALTALVSRAAVTKL